ncbi:MAG: hypothetical protein Tp1102DCM295711_31 [Prokaryotic dsDNA virus sp.]|nr:MAG: hypothetical protein Tp1102DCM295711_31 [Prokaryotic dsDNA virus sp.]|tara:strand:+ start:13813 stop:14004 length:192 start_codon:yes stop_codon:yes gene_type:complete
MLFTNIHKPEENTGPEIKDFWTDERVIEFIRTSTQGQYWIYKGCKTLGMKMKAYKEWILKGDK